MAAIITKLTTSGNSKAVRLPAALLKISELNDIVEIEASQGQIIVRNTKNARSDWKPQIIRVQKEQGTDDDFSDLSASDSDGLTDLPWDGPSFEEWTHQREV